MNEMNNERCTEWFKSAFGKDYLDIYSHRNFSEAEKHVKFAIEILGIEKSHKILDLGCGFGRHSRCFFDLGHQIFGLDLSRTLLDRANDSESNQLSLIQADMRAIPMGGQIDRVVSFFTSFGYFETDEENAAVLVEITRVLKPGGLLFFDYMNSVKVVAELVSRDEIKRDGYCLIQKRSFNSKNKRIEKEISICDNEGERCYLESVRAFSYQEILNMFNQAGLDCLARYGDYDGNKYQKDSQRLILVGKKR